MKKSCYFIALFSIVLSAFHQNAKADHTTLDCKIEGGAMKAPIHVTKEYDVDCWNQCKVEFKNEKLNFTAEISNKGSELSMKFEDLFFKSNRANKAVIYGEPALMSCYSGSMNGETYQISCKYCQID